MKIWKQVDRVFIEDISMTEEMVSQNLSPVETINWKRMERICRKETGLQDMELDFRCQQIIQVAMPKKGIEFDSVEL